MLSACGKGENDPGPGGVTMGEARALDDAAKMLDARRPPAAALHASDAGTSDAVDEDGSVAPDR